MGIDVLVMLECAPKRTLGAGDPYRGGLRLVDLLKKRQWLDAGRTAVGDVTTIDVNDGTAGRSYATAELIAETAVLEELGAACASCPANALRQPFGCWAYVRYPISAVAEAWLVSCVEPADRVGGRLLLQQLGTGAIGGEPIASIRRSSRAAFAADVPATRVLVKGWFRSTTVSSDQLFHALLCRGPTVNPEVGMLILIWLGRVSIDGRPPAEIAFDAVSSLLMAPTTVEARFERTDLVAGDPVPDPSAAELKLLLRLLYVSWILGVPTALQA